MTDDLSAALARVGERFDLGEYERVAYLAVLDHGELTASDIADRTDIPQPRVYDTVRRLADRGLVELRESRPMTVVAVDPEEAFGGVRASLDDLVADLEARFTAPPRDTDAVTLVKSRSTILRYLADVLEAAEYELAVSLTPSLLDRFAEDLAAAVADGVAVDLLVTPASGAPDPADYDYGAVATNARARRGITTPVLAVADGVHSVYATQDALRDEAERYGVIFERSALGFLVSGFFGTVLWSTSESLHAGDATRAFPRTYASVRRAVTDVRAADGDVYASVRGRDVVTGESVAVAGRVVDTAFERSGTVASLTVAGDDGEVTVGGLVAAYEDVEAREIRLGRDAPPERE